MSNRDINTSKENYQPDEKIYSTKEFASRLGVSIRTLFNHRRIGLLNFSQSCNKAPVLFSQQDEIDYRNNIRRQSQHK